jgi:hypothetical protein
MNFYNSKHPYYCGIDLHARSLYVCIIDQDGTTLLHKEIPADPLRLKQLLEPYPDQIVVGVECMHSVRSPDSPYLLRPCSRVGTGYLTSAKTRVSSSFLAMRFTCVPFTAVKPRMTASIP